MKALVQANKVSKQRVLAARTSANQERFSQFPAVMDTEFWGEIYRLAGDRKTAGSVLNDMKRLEDQPCAENDRVMRCIATAYKIAQRTLALH